MNGCVGEHPGLCLPFPLLQICPAAARRRNLLGNLGRVASVCALYRRQYAALLHQANLLFLLGRGLLFDAAADDPLLQVRGSGFRV
jgi:hypothetical protein